ncbi:MAG: universal stress protein, partial [Betaproteobacteria bacterium]|nr:universal stress protein [Betaproteobacteria bacterium]
LVNVQPKPQEWQTHGMEPEAIESHLAVHAHGALKPVQHLLNEAGIAYHTYLKLGEAAETVAALADELGCDHIVMGTRGLGGISGIVLGSVTRKVLHLANIPVVCIKSEPSRR